MEVVFAAVPLAAAVAVLLLRGWPATRAAGLGCGLALLLAAVHPSFAVAPAALGGALLAGAVTTLAVVAVVYGGLLLYHVTQAGGAITRLATALAGLGADRAGLALLLVLGWGPFVESASGFGVAAAVTCPLLLALGFPAARAIPLALLGLCAVPWGALAVGTVLGAGLTGLPLPALGAVTALLTAPLLLYYAAVAGALADGRAAWRRWPLAATLALTLAVVVWAVSRWLSVEIAGLAGGLAALALGAAWLFVEQRSRGAEEQRSDTGGEMERWGDGESERRDEGEDHGPRSSPRAAARAALPLTHLHPRLPSPHLPISPSPHLLRAAAPYALLVGVLLLTRLVGPLAEVLRGPALATPDGAARFAPLASPALALILAALGGAALLGVSPGGVGAAAARSARQWWRPALATAGFVALGGIMAATGMTASLARALAGLGPAYLVAAAPLAGLAGLVTGSNAGANAMLAGLGVEAAGRLGLAPVLVLAMQNAAASTTTMASPARLLLAVAVAGLAAAERPAAEAAATRLMLLVVGGAVALLMLIGALLLALPGATAADAWG